MNAQIIQLVTFVWMDMLRMMKDYVRNSLVLLISGHTLTLA